VFLPILGGFHYLSCAADDASKLLIGSAAISETTFPPVRANGVVSASVGCLRKPSQSRLRCGQVPRNTSKNSSIKAMACKGEKRVRGCRRAPDRSR
jgi:hypothetical protein